MKEDKSNKRNKTEDKTSRRTIRSVIVNGVEKRYKPTKHYVFIMQVKYSDDSECIIYRSYSDFYAFHISLLERFPIAAGDIRPEERIIPYLPGRRILRRNEIQKVANKRQEDLYDYCNDLVKLKDSISKDKLIVEFFEVKETDRRPSEEARKKPEKSSLLAALLPFFNKKSSRKDSLRGSDEDLSISGPMKLEPYRAIASYKATNRTELGFEEGDTVDVLEKSDSGWWLAVLDKDQGWVPASYLEPEEGETEQDEPEPNYEGEMYLTLEPYTAEGDDEVSFEKGVIVDVMHKQLDGWWIASYNGQVGYIPAIYLEPYKNEHLRPSQSVMHRRKLKLNPRRETVKRKSRKYSGEKVRQKDLGMYRSMSKKSRAFKGRKPPMPIPQEVAMEEESEEASYENISNINADRAPAILPRGASAGHLGATAGWQGEAACRQGEEEGWRGKAAGRQGATAGWQGDAVGGQGEAAGRKGKAAGRQGATAGWQGEDAGRQGATAGWQGEATGRQGATGGRHGNNTNMSNNHQAPSLNLPLKTHKTPKSPRSPVPPPAANKPKHPVPHRLPSVDDADWEDYEDVIPPLPYNIIPMSSTSHPSSEDRVYNNEDLEEFTVYENINNNQIPIEDMKPILPPREPVAVPTPVPPPAPRLPTRSAANSTANLSPAPKHIAKNNNRNPKTRATNQMPRNGAINNTGSSHAHHQTAGNSNNVMIPKSSPNNAFSSELNAKLQKQLNKVSHAEEPPPPPAKPIRSPPAANGAYRGSPATPNNHLSPRGARSGSPSAQIHAARLAMFERS